jgi:hypothetical protein
LRRQEVDPAEEQVRGRQDERQGIDLANLHFGRNLFRPISIKKYNSHNFCGGGAATPCASPLPPIIIFLFTTLFISPLTSKSHDNNIHKFIQLLWAKKAIHKMQTYI